MNDAGDPPLRPPPERSAASVVTWIAATLLVVAALVFAWDPPPSPDVAAASMALPALPSLPDPAAPSSEPARDEASTALPSTAASGTELIEVCGVGWVPPGASGAADRAAVAADNEVLASQRALLAALRRGDGEVGEAMASVLELQGAGRENGGGTPLQALTCVPAGSAACAGRDDDRQLAATLVERLAKLATATREPRVYALAMQQCQWTKGQGSCALLNLEQWALVDDGNALPWLHILRRARDRNDPAQIEEALYHLGMATRVEEASYAVAGRVADLAGASDVDVIAAELLAVDALAATSRVEPYAVVYGVCRDSLLADANRRQACEHAAETLADRSDSLMAVLAGAELGRRLGWSSARVDTLRALQQARQSMDQASSASETLAELPSSCSSARRVLASFSRKAGGGEVQAVRAWLASRGGPAALLARAPAQPATSRADDAVRPESASAPAAVDAASAALAVAVTAAPPALPVAEAIAANAAAASSPEAAAASAIRYSAAPPPDR